jgi:hypothetical protein
MSVSAFGIRRFAFRGAKTQPALKVRQIGA